MGMRQFWNRTEVMAAQQHEYINATELYTFHTIPAVNFTLCEFHLNCRKTTQHAQPLLCSGAPSVWAQGQGAWCASNPGGRQGCAKPLHLHGFQQLKAMFLGGLQPRASPEHLLRNRWSSQTCQQA